MKFMTRSISLSVAFLAVTLFLLSFTLSANAQTLYSCESPFGDSNPFFHTLNPNTGATISTTEMTLAGQTVRGCNGMAKHPQTDVCYVMLNITPDPDDGPIPPRVLATINQNTGIATAIGGADQTFASIAFTSDGTLYGVTGDGGGTPETLFTININNGDTTLVTALGNGDDGEAIAFNPLDGLIYHGSGNGPPFNLPDEQIFESINPQTLAITPIPISGDLLNPFDDDGELTALVHQSNNVLLTGTIAEEFYSITTGGATVLLGNMDHVSKGLAFDCGGATQVPTLSEWGLITTVIALGLVSFFVLRRRSAFQK